MHTTYSAGIQCFEAVTSALTGSCKWNQTNACTFSNFEQHWHFCSSQSARTSKTEFCQETGKFRNTTTCEQ